MKNIIIWMLGLFLPPLAVAQTAQFGPLYWSASSTGAVQITTATYLAFPAVVDTLNLTITALNTTTAWTVNLYVASSPSGPWTTNCPGGTINGAAITVSAGTTLNLNCKPQGAAFLQIYVTAGTGGGQLVGSIAGTNSSIGAAPGGPFLPLSGGTMTGQLNLNYAYPTISMVDNGGTVSRIFMTEVGVETDFRLASCGYQMEMFYDSSNGAALQTSASGAPVCNNILAGSYVQVANLLATTAQSQHFIAGGTAVTIAGTGGSPTCVSNTTCLDYRGRLSIPASTTSTTVTFSTAYATSPVCTVTQNGGATFFIPAWSSTTTVLTITTGITLTTAEEFDYTCVQ